MYMSESGDLCRQFYIDLRGEGWPQSKGPNGPCPNKARHVPSKAQVVWSPRGPGRVRWWSPSSPHPQRPTRHTGSHHPDPGYSRLMWSKNKPHTSMAQKIISVMSKKRPNSQWLLNDRLKVGGYRFTVCYDHWSRTGQLPAILHNKPVSRWVFGFSNRTERRTQLLLLQWAAVVQRATYFVAGRVTQPRLLCLPVEQTSHL